jgi:hypothetical protein
MTSSPGSAGCCVRGFLYHKEARPLSSSLLSFLQKSAGAICPGGFFVESTLFGDVLLNGFDDFGIVFERFGEEDLTRVNAHAIVRTMKLRTKLD